VNDQPQNETHKGGENPAQADVEEGENLLRKADRAVQMKGGFQIRGQRLGKIEQGGDAGESRDADVDSPVVMEQIPEQRQQNQGDRQRVQEQQQRQGIADDLGQTEIGDQEGKYGKYHRPGAVGKSLGEHAGESVRAAGDETNGGFQAGAGDGDCQNETARPSQVVAGDLRQGDAAVFGGLKQTSGLGAHENGGNVDHNHGDAGEQSGGQNILCHVGIVGNAHGADDVDDHNAEGQTGNGVHGVIALNEAQRKRPGLITGGRLHVGNGGGGIDQRRHHQNGEEDQKDGGDDLTDPDGDLAGAQRQNQHDGEEDHGEDQQRGGLGCASAQHGRDAHGEGSGRASGDGEAGADGQVEQAGEDVAVALADLVGQLLQAVGVGVADGGYAHDRNTDSRDDKADHGGKDVPSGQLTEMNGENQIAGAEEHAEQRSGHQNLLLECKMFLHFILPPSV